MSNHPTTFAEWQSYPSTLDPIHLAWLKSAKKSKTAFAVADIEGIEISHKKFLTGVLLFSKKIEEYSPEQNVGLLLPSSGGGAIASMAILSLGKTLVNFCCIFDVHILNLLNVLFLYEFSFLGFVV